MARQIKGLPNNRTKQRRPSSMLRKPRSVPKRAADKGPSRKLDLRLAAAELHQLTLPTSVWQKLAWIEARGVPDYLELAGMEKGTFNGQQTYGYPPVLTTVRLAEVQEVYREAFAQSASDLSGQKAVLGSYAAAFPHLAFDPAGWLWPLWRGWQAQYEAADRQLLTALANGIKRKGAGWMSVARQRAWRLGQSRVRLENLRAATKDLTTSYKMYCEGARSRDADVRVSTERRYLPPIVERIRELSGHTTSGPELQKLTLSGVLRVAVARLMCVRERNLH